MLVGQVHAARYDGAGPSATSRNQVFETASSRRVVPSDDDARAASSRAIRRACGGRITVAKDPHRLVGRRTLVPFLRRCPLEIGRQPFALLRRIPGGLITCFYIRRRFMSAAASHISGQPTRSSPYSSSELDTWIHARSCVSQPAYSTGTTKDVLALSVTSRLR